MTMTVLENPATTLNRRDEIPNRDLALRIIQENNTEAARQLVDYLLTGNRNIQADCIKVLCEIGERNPDLIADYHAELGTFLESRNNRMVWGAMATLDTIALSRPKEIHAMLPRIIAAAKSGTVITRDHAVGIMTKLGTLKRYANDCIPPLIEQLTTCPTNQFPMYAEKSLAVITGANREIFRNTFTGRLDDLRTESQRKRVLKVLKRINDGGK
ncbi:MAG: hypothetical protein JWQ98_1664 [Chlorobi bacterium]|nr:hypothetical protein [Chlorobiota bacterium]